MQASGTAGIGLILGVLGAGATTASTVRALGNDPNSSISSALGGPTISAIGTGAGFLLFASQHTFKSQVMRKFALGGATTFLMGGIASALAGAIPGIDGGKPVIGPFEKSLRAPKNHPQRAVDEVDDLAGVPVATGLPYTLSGDRPHVPVFLDTRQAVSGGRSFEGAKDIAEARAHKDEKIRSQAVVRLEDGTYQVVPLRGGLDQIDGEFFADKENQYDFEKRDDLRVRTLQKSVQAIVGVEYTIDMREADKP